MPSHKKNSTSQKFCRCIKQVQKTRKNKTESPAIAICVRSVLGSRGRTLKKFTCRGRHPRVITQAPLQKRGGGCGCDGFPTPKIL